MNQQKVAGWLDMVRSFLVPAMFPVLLGCSFALRALLAFACAVLTAPLARRFGLSTTLESRMRLAVLAASPAIVLRTVLDVAGVSLPYEAPSFFLVTLCYLYFGLRACRSLTADSPASA